MIYKKYNLQWRKGQIQGEQALYTDVCLYMFANQHCCNTCSHVTQKTCDFSPASDQQQQQLQLHGEGTRRNGIGGWSTKTREWAQKDLTDNQMQHEGQVGRNRHENMHRARRYASHFLSLSTVLLI